MIYLELAVVFTAAWLLSGVLLRVLESMQVIDQPNPRSSHSISVPRGGGLAIILVYIAAMAWLPGAGVAPGSTFYTVLAAGGGLVALTGLFDDVRGLRPLPRFFLHLAAALLGAWLLGVPAVSLIAFHWTPDAVLFALEVIVLVWILNFFNFMDGIDAIAGIEAVSIALGAAAVLWFAAPGHDAIAALVLLAAATAGFLAWNWPPAKIFMGDTASSFLGFTLGLFAVATSVDGSLNIWSWLILFGVFFTDATVTVSRRILRREKFYEAHRDHAYQRLARALQAGRSDVDPVAARAAAHRTVSLLVATVNLLWLTPLALLAGLVPQWGVLWSALALTPLVGVALHAGAGSGKP